MSVALYEFPLCEKVRNYLRLEHLFARLHEAKSATTENQHLYFLEVLFNMLELLERLDLRTDFLRDIDGHERKLEHWSKHPDIDTEALENALQSLRSLSAEIKKNKKLGANLREEKFLSAIRQRFAIPGGVTSFDVPMLFCWLKQPEQVKQNNMSQWLTQLQLIETTMQTLMSFLREKGRFHETQGVNGYYQSSQVSSDEKLELVRVRCDNADGFYPVLSGSRNRFGIKFMQLNTETGTSTPVTQIVSFAIASC
ncbi:cell division protein ZapD [Glaciecola petra]|uniref:Cell division protein ZapD n=1 Tax=Glaciecola petra TaxID=3075602 RepID=A0ABU2ZPX4_9ALTE|nr:cell division protein ZapD [Aestuariibacter sp. P117]MDT0593512.1 cell division protein ZapD [Aestuariibacter sp. P117]